MALYPMEAGRPAVDAFVLDLLTSRVLAVRDFDETRRLLLVLNGVSL